VEVRGGYLAGVDKGVDTVNYELGAGEAHSGEAALGGGGGCHKRGEEGFLPPHIGCGGGEDHRIGKAKSW